MPEIAYVNGTFCPIADAKVSIEDRGFQFADGVYEVVDAFGEKVFRLKEHLDRLQRSLNGICLSFDIKEQGIERIIREGIARAGFAETMVYLQITRGAASRLLAYREGLQPTVVATFKPRPTVDPAVRERGLSVITVPDIRWARCFIKSVALLPNSLARNEAVRRGYDDAIFVTASGEVREATASNVFVVCDGALLTPPKSESILHGVTRGYVLDCAKRIELPCIERTVTDRTLTDAQEVFLSSTTVDVIGVTRINDTPVGDGKVGPMTHRLYDRFQTGKAELRA